MAILKCKMCGGDLEITQGISVAECDYCGTKQTLPTAKDEVVQNLFNRANNLRIKCEFDKAEQIYEKILQQNGDEAEAHWGIILCRYGIEYVEDPKTFKRIPTCHRTSYESITASAEYKSAIANADPDSRLLYQEEARAIDEIQKNILDIVRNEKPFDVFLCYKETDENGKRTMDSAIANEIYHQLTLEGLKVFYAAITLEDKLGQAYEPYIFAALNSAKAMLVIGSKPEYFGAVWVKNEWSRYLKLMKTDRSKLLIPCYRDMDAYDLPEEFAHLQAQDMSKIGFINDVVRGIKKVVAKDEPKAETVVKETVVAPAATGTAPLLKRAFMFLEDGEWDRADDFCEQVLNLDPECARAYLGKLMAELHAKKQEHLQRCMEPFDRKNNYQKTIRFGDEALKKELAGYIDDINTRNENARMEGIYTRAKEAMSTATEKAYMDAAVLFGSIRGYKDAAQLIELCKEKAEECRQQAEIDRKNAIYTKAKTHMSVGSLNDYRAAISALQSIPGWKDADRQVEICQAKIAEITAKIEADRLEAERQAEIKRQEDAKQAKKLKFVTIVALGIVCAIAVAAGLVNTLILQPMEYNDAIDLMESGKYEEAIQAFEAMDGYKDSEDKILECRYSFAVELMEEGEYAEAAVLFREANGYQDSEAKQRECLAPLFQRVTIAANGNHSLGLKADGTVVAVGSNDDGQCNVFSWTDIVAIATGYHHSLGLKADGTVVAAGDNYFGQCDVSDWKDIVAIAAGWHYSLGLKADGTVVAVGSNAFYQCDVSGWTDIVAIATGGYHSLGLKADGTVVAAGDNDYGKCDVSQWTDIVAIVAGGDHSLGLKADGTVVAVGRNGNGQCDVSQWTDIVAIAAGYSHSLGLKADGTVVAVGYNDYGQCDVSDWKDIRLPESGENS